MDYLHRMRTRAAVIGAIRHTFGEADFIEVDTPVSVSAPAPEPHIDAPAVTLRTGGGTVRRFLQPSPELLMKRLLARGFERIFQIAVVFRNDDIGLLHCPEFRLVEWYRRRSHWTDLLDDCEMVLRAAAEAAGRGGRFSYQGRAVNLEEPFRRVTVDEAFTEFAGFSILEALERDVLRDRLNTAGISSTIDDSWNDLFHRIFLSRVEPPLINDPQPLFLTDYPAPLSSLARLNPNDPRVSERFELFAGGLELANGFGELVDAAEQRRRFEHDRVLRRSMGKVDYPIDERFLDALTALPPCAGIAMGLERLLMLLLDAADIEEVAFIPWSAA